MNCTSGVFFFFIECCFTSVFWLENQMSHQNTPSACHVLRRSASLCTWADYSLLPNLNVYPPPITLHMISVITAFLRFVWSMCLHSVLAGLHPVFYELWEDIKVADTSIRWCQLSVAVTGLLHLSHGRGEEWPQATGGSSEPVPTSHFSLQYDSQALSRRTKLLNEAIGFW